MHAKEERQRLQAFEDLCRRQGLPLTVQRRIILEAVLEGKDHPTADQVFRDVEGRLPGLSRTTVYRVLDTLVRLGVILKVCHPGAAARFDAKVHRHHHLVCLGCGKMVDLEDEQMDAIPIPNVQSLGFEINDFSIHFSGLCSACSQTSRKKTTKTRNTAELSKPESAKQRTKARVPKRRRPKP